MKIRIEVTKEETKSYLAMLDMRLQEAEKEKVPLVTTANKILRYFVPTIFGLAIISALVMGFVFSPLSAIQCAMSVLVAACPCTFGLITPLAIKIGLAKSADNGITFKSGKSLEKVNQIDTVVFDLNGTLTTGVYRVTKTTVPIDM